MGRAFHSLAATILLQLFYVAIVLGGCTLSRAFDRRRIPKASRISKVDIGDHESVNAFFRESAAVAPYDAAFYFDRLIDHAPSKGTFKQKHRHRGKPYNEDGPIIFMDAEARSM
ncbi:hypothetical protein F5146DRAFT_247042 [Armillaria mellea]|nr:hypothetical protein F5146DRAFT_247042 [Armillaria mellea]